MSTALLLFEAVPNAAARAHLGGNWLLGQPGRQVADRGVLAVGGRRSAATQTMEWLATVGMLAFYAAMAKGKASIVGPLTALFPLFTVAGAVLFLHERLSRAQLAGVVFALAAVVVFAQ